MVTEAERKERRDQRWAKLVRATHYVYALCEPCLEFRPRYVGVSIDLETRLKDHKSSPVTLAMSNWMESLDGRLPRLVVLETVDRWHAGQDAESWWIRHLIDQGHPLLNKSRLDHWRDASHMNCVRRDAARRIRRMFTKHYHQPKQYGPQRPTHRILEHNGERLPAAAWAKRLGISRQRLHQRLQKQPVEVALSYGRGERSPLSGTGGRPRKERPPKPERIKKGPSYVPMLTRAERRERRKLIAARVAEGRSVDEVATEFGVTTVTVKAALREFSCQEAAA